MPAWLPRRTAVAIVILALAVRLAAGFWWQARLPPGEQFFFGDSATYWTLGQRLARGESYEYQSAERRVFRAPGYPLLLSAMFRVFGADPPVMFGRALSAMLGALSVALVIGWAGWLFDPRTGLVAGVIATFYPGLIGIGVFVLSEAAFCPLLVAQLWLWGAASRSESGRQRLLLSAAAGIAAGLATLVRPSWLLFTPFAWLVALVFSRHRRRHLASGLAMLLLLCVVLAPWWIRNVRVIGHFVPTTLQVGASLYDGLNPTATGASDMRFVSTYTTELHAADAAGPEPPVEPFEYRLDRLLASDAVHWARSHRRRVLELAGIKVLRLWNVWPNETELRGWGLRIIVLATYLPILLVGLYGAWRYTPQGWEYAVAWLPAVYLTMLHTIFVSSIRYREPAMLALIVLAAGAIAFTGARRTNVDTSKSKAAGGSDAGTKSPQQKRTTRFSPVAPAWEKATVPFCFASCAKLGQSPAVLGWQVSNAAG